MKVKEYAMQLIEAACVRSLLPELLPLRLEKEQVRNIVMQFGVPDIYNFSVYRLLGLFGDKETLKTLEAMQSDQTLSPEVKADIKLAIKDLQRNITEQERREASPDYMIPRPLFPTMIAVPTERVEYEITPAQFPIVRIAGIAVGVVLIILGIYLNIRRRMKR